MRRLIFFASLFGLVFPFYQASAAVTATASSLVPDPILVRASSADIGLFALTLSQDAGETLSSVAVTVANAGDSAAGSSDIATLKVFKDDGDSMFEPNQDAEAGSQTTVNVGSPSIITTGTNNTITGGMFFVSFATAALWSDTSPKDSITVSLAVDAITTSENSPSITPLTTSTVTADTTAPTLTSVVAKNTGGTSAKEAGDALEFTFSESTNKLAVTAANIANYLSLNNSHSFLDGAASIGGAAWNTEGTVLTVTLSAATSLPSVEVGDEATIAGSDLQDLAGNSAAGSKVITGSFTEASTGDDEGTFGARCGNAVINGRLYKIGDEPTVYLAAACRLKPFRGAAVFNSRGLKFANIITLPSLPENVKVLDKPVLPAPGTLVQGDDKTVWFVDKHGKKRGFTREDVFRRLGFLFERVKKISQSDLDQIPADDPIDTDSTHPDGAIIKCGNSAAVFQVVGNAKFPFTSAEVFQNRGNSFEHILVVDCGRFRYLQGAGIK